MALLSLVAVADIIMLQLILRWRKRRFRQLVYALRYELCLVCGYGLTGLPDAHARPECGSTYSKENLRASWKPWIDGKTNETSDEP